MKPVAIIGAGGFGREVLDIYNARSDDGDEREVLGFIVDERFARPGVIVNGLPVLGGLEWLAERAESVSAICGIGDTVIRRHTVRRCIEAGVSFDTVVHPSATVSRWVPLGPGPVLTAGCRLTNQIQVAAHVHINLNSTLGHDVVIEDYVTIAPGVNVSGNVVIEEGANIGTGSAIIERRRIGAWSIVGAGSSVTQDIPPNSTAVGVPCKVIKSREPGWHLAEPDHG